MWASRRGGSLTAGCRLLGLSTADGAAIEHALFDVAAAHRRHQRRTADRRRARAGVEADQDKPGDVAADRAQRGLVPHDLSGPPRGPQQTSRF
jgi:hypothetical protein